MYSWKLYYASLRRKNPSKSHGLLAVHMQLTLPMTPSTLHVAMIHKALTQKRLSSFNDVMSHFLMYTFHVLHSIIFVFFVVAGFISKSCNM